MSIRIFKSMTFKFMLLSVVLIYLQINGNDTKSIMLIEMNVILNHLLDMESVKTIIQSGPMIKSRTMTGETSLYVYILHFASFLIYGLAFDLLMKIIIKTEAGKKKGVQ